MSSDAVPLEDRSGAPGRPSSSSESTEPSHTPLRTADYDEHPSDEEDAAEGLLARADGAEGMEEKHAGFPRRARARTASFSFDFSSRLLQLEASDELSSAERGVNGGKVKEHVSFVGGVALIVGIVIGSGIFSSPGVVAAETGSVGTALLVWAIAGVLSWAGGSSFAELGTALPGNGGHQVYLNAAFGPLAASAEYLCRIFWHTAFEPDPRAAVRTIPTVAIKLVAIAGLFLISAVHAWSTKAGTRTQLVVTVFKVLALLLVFIGGIVYLITSKPASDFSFHGSSHKPAGYALALFSALWTFDGWDAANYVAKDVAPGVLPLMINSSMAVIVVLFLAANVSYFLVLPFDIATATTTIGLDFGRALAGPVGGLLFAIVISISALGALNGTLYTSSRLIVAASEQGFLPRAFSNFHKSRKTPINGILLSSTLSTIFICLGDFSSLTLFYGVAAWTWNFSAVIGLLVLRRTEPTLKRPYRTFLVTPILFASTALFLIVLSCFSRPIQSFAAFAFCVAGVVPYYLHVRRSEPRASDGLEMT
ncbi:High-affinity methionine permease [Rhodotorula toruloides]|nr:High-affinity methionine permease [Rhodotorula toruloides]